MTERQGTGQGMRRSSHDSDAVEQLAGSVAHDLTNMLTIVTGYCAYLAENPSLTQDQRQSLDHISQAGRRAVSLTDQLLAFTCQQVPHQTLLDLNSFIATIEPAFRTKSGEKIAVTILQDQTLGLVKVDPSKLHQAIMNLVVTAGAAMQEGGRLTIETASVELAERSNGPPDPNVSPGSYVMLAISHAGSGMKDDPARHPCEPSFATQAEGNNAQGGFFTVSELVEQIGGSIQVERAAGRDPSVRIYLPRVDQPVTSEAAEVLSGGKAGGQETILVAEDEPGVRTLVCLSLRRQGYAVLEAQDGAEALTIAGQHQGPLHLFLTDAAMPRMGGLEAMKRLMAQRPELKVLFMSGYTETALVARCLYEPGLPFIQKPFSYDELAGTVRQLLTACEARPAQSLSRTAR